LLKKTVTIHSLPVSGGHMQHPLVVVFVIVGVLIFPACSYGSDTGELVETFEEGWINWMAGVVAAQGIGAPLEKKTDETEARKTALAAAHQNGWHNILKIVERVRINSTFTVADLAAKNDEISSKLADMARAAEVIKQEYLSDGTVAVTLQLSLHGGFAQMLLPYEIEQIETIKAVTATDQTGSGHAVKKTTSDKAPDVYTGLVVDARGLAVIPALAPTILDEKEQEVYGPGIVSREFAVQQGVSGYARDLKVAQQAKRVQNAPLTVKALRIREHKRSDIVISNADAAKLRSSFEHLKLLKECRVVIVVD
jgi:hypothetical protein